MSEQEHAFDLQIRRFVYDYTMRAGTPPQVREIESTLSLAEAPVRAALERLATQHVLVLQRESGEILMANPFSAVPTAFPVIVGPLRTYGNCIWDALGIAAMLQRDARVQTACGCCGSAMELTVENGALAPAEGVIHFAVPAIQWWADIVFT